MAKAKILTFTRDFCTLRFPILGYSSSPVNRPHPSTAQYKNSKIPEIKL
jgi:hypothetical protein